jgi:Glycosyltransferase family 87
MIEYPSGPFSSAKPWHAFAGLLVVLLACFSYRLMSFHELTRFGDFSALWSYARIALSQGAAVLYDPAALHAQQVALGMEDKFLQPYPYPPIFLLLIEPIGMLSMNAAFLVFMGLTLIAYGCAIFVGSKPLKITTLAIAIIPTTSATISCGQTGFLSAALLIGGVRLASAYPAMGGMLIGILAYKPQLGVLIPLAMASAGLWRAAVTATVTILGLVLASGLVFGWALWPAWFAYLPIYNAEFHPELVWLSSSIADTARYLGMAPRFAYGMQIVAGSFAAWLTWRACRGGMTPVAITVLAVATFFVTPHAFIYDLPMVSGALMLYANQQLAGTPRSEAGTSMLAVVLLFAVPGIAAIPMLPFMHAPVAMLFPAAVLAVTHRDMLSGLVPFRAFKRPHLTAASP